MILKSNYALCLQKEHRAFFYSLIHIFSNAHFAVKTAEFETSKESSLLPDDISRISTFKAHSLSRTIEAIVDLFDLSVKKISFALLAQIENFNSGYSCFNSVKIFTASFKSQSLIVNERCVLNVCVSGLEIISISMFSRKNLLKSSDKKHVSAGIL